MDEDTIEEKKKPERVKKKTPKDLLTLYMDNLADMQEEFDFQKLYAKLLFSIDIGKDMLTDKHAELREKAEQILLDRRTYPGNRDIRIDSSGQQYQVSSSDGAGHMKFRLEGTAELKEGIEDIKNQQATMLIPRLRKIDGEIKRALQRENIIVIKTPDIEEIFKNRILSSMNDKKIEDKVDEVVEVENADNN